MRAGTPAILSLRDVSRAFARRGQAVAALGGISLDVAAGEFVTIVGPSGCGKSTLLKLVSGGPCARTSSSPSRCAAWRARSGAGGPAP
jgi:ABC-type nitrate/sulfonate/bicarbonate transport system ATPase subunit